MRLHRVVIVQIGLVFCLAFMQDAAAQVAPTKVSEIVVRPNNLQQATPACAPNLEIGFLDLTVPRNQVLMLNGFYWGAASAPGQLVEAQVYVTDGNPGNRRHVAPLSGITGTNNLFAGFQSFPTPVPSLRGTFKHLCVEGRQGTMGTSSFWIFGFFARDI